MREEFDPGRPHDVGIAFPLMDPPGVREKLAQEIKYLVSYLHGRYLNVNVYTFVCSTIQYRSPSTTHYLVI